MFFKKHTKPAIQPNIIPPIIVNCVNEFTVCGSYGDIEFWLTAKNMEQSTSFVIYDPDGSLREQYGRTFKHNGYRVKVFNPADFEKSAKYNPFEYVKNDKDISVLVTAVMNGTKGRGKRGDLSFLTLESVLLTAIFGFVSEEAPSVERNFGIVIEMLNAMEPDRKPEYCDDYKHAVDFLFEETAKRSPGSLYVKRYEHYKKIVGRNEKTAVKSCISRLYPLGSYEARDFFSADELGLDSLYCPQTALFVMPGNSGAFGFTVPLMYTQLFNMLYEKSVEF